MKRLWRWLRRSGLVEQLEFDSENQLQHIKSLTNQRLQLRLHVWNLFADNERLKRELDDALVAISKHEAELADMQERCENGAFDREAAEKLFAERDERIVNLEAKLAEAEGWLVGVRR